MRQKTPVPSSRGGVLFERVCLKVFVRKHVFKSRRLIGVCGNLKKFKESRAPGVSHLLKLNSLKLTALGLIALVFVSDAVSGETPTRAEITSELAHLQKPSAGESFNKFHRTLRTVGDAPNTQVATHNIGNIQVGHTNLGQFGTGFVGAVSDPVTGEALPSCIFPANSNLNHLYVSAFWIGAVIGRDTLVSSGADDGFAVHEFWPGANDEIVQRSIIPSDQFFSPLAVSEQDIIATYYDTLTTTGITLQDFIDNRPHIPLNIKIKERSLQWSYDYAGDFVLFDYEITNIGIRRLEKVYMGIYVDGDIHHTSKTGLAAFGDDICGFRRVIDAECGFFDTINIAYVMDNDGDPVNEAWDKTTSIRSAAGVRLVRTPSDSLVYSFNWWSASPGPDFGPRKAGTELVPFRDMDGFIGAPHGDRNKYYVMSNREFDYDQIFAAVNQTSEGWLPPAQGSLVFATGGDPRYLLSFGPFDIFPGESLPVTFAYVAGLKFHTAPNDYVNLLASSQLQPEAFRESLNFTELGTNSRWASWIYDNPGVDTDNDGFRGKSRVCILDSSAFGFKYDTFYNSDSSAIDSVVFDSFFSEVDTFFYEGDGVPDFLGAAPPPAPVLRVLPEVGRLTIRWNGFVTETTPDPFSDIKDFEGYRVFSGRTNTLADYTLQTSFDVKNYNRYVFDRQSDEFVLIVAPFTLAELQSLYGLTFNPLNYGIDNPFVFQSSGAADTTYYFTQQDWNRDELNAPGTIETVYDRSTLTKPSDNPADWTADELTDGLPKWYEYQFVLDDLLPSIPIYVSVTAFDYGSRESGLSSLETSPLLNSVLEFPLMTSEQATRTNSEVIVYPNPYKIDGRYREIGFEGAGEDDLPDERVRAINFINLPLVCTISIYSLDGDLVRSIEHNQPSGSPRSMHETWSLITRNNQLASSGIYYYVVETPDGQIQMGKLVLIM